MGLLVGMRLKHIIAMRFDMKKMLLIGTILLCCISFWTAISTANDVYVYKLTGNQFFLLTGQGESESKKQLRIMQPIPTNSILEIGADTTAYITCPGCDVVTLTKSNSPFAVEADAFKIKTSKNEVLTKHFLTAIKEFIYPNSKEGDFVSMKVRADEKPLESYDCITNFPQDYENIIALGEYIFFEWTMNGENFIYELHDLLNGKLIYTAKTKETTVKIPFDKLNKGVDYQWIVYEKNQNTTCQASFFLLPEEETNELKKIIDGIAELLPKDVDSETKTRLKSSYLLSEGYTYNAYALLKK